MAEPLLGSDRLGPVRDGHAHRDARPFRLPAFSPRPAFPAPRQILSQVRRPLRFGVGPPVETLVADPHRRVAGVLGLQPSLDQFRTPPPAQRVQHPGAKPVRVHATRFPGLAPTTLGLPLRGQRRIEQPRGPRPGLRPFRPVGPVRLVLVGREPQAAPRLAAHRGLVPAGPLLGRQVRILSAHECNTFLSWKLRTLPTLDKVLHFYLELGIRNRFSAFCYTYSRRITLIIRRVNVLLRGCRTAWHRLGYRKYEEHGSPRMVGSHA
ncbi:Hypothetical protein RY69_2177 [Bifidobacterium breve]|nr:Hypothetical protein RY69_2177 [Bifidobacterium breve]